MVNYTVGCKVDMDQMMLVSGDSAVSERVWATWCVCRWLAEGVGRHG